ncbi:MAG: hypothetical protein ABEJ04_02465 [Halobacteriaceae archaeon]
MSEPEGGDPRWWYGVVLAPMVASLVLVVGLAVGTVALLAVSADLSTYAPAYFALTVMAVPTAVVYPVSLYRDARYVADRDVAWTPDPVRYAVAAVVAVGTGLVLSIPVSAYYLRKRDRTLGLA